MCDGSTNKNSLFALRQRDFFSWLTIHDLQAGSALHLQHSVWRLRHAATLDWALIGQSGGNGTADDAGASTYTGRPTCRLFANGLAG